VCFVSLHVADCGAGIGRVTKHLLLPEFEHVDLLEQSPRLIAAAPGYIGPEAQKRVTCLCQGMQVGAT
jgi:protein N-terminal methyltransferase